MRSHYSSGDFARCLKRAGKRVHHLRRLKAVAEQRIANAMTIGWKALEQSWRVDLQRVNEAMEGGLSDESGV